MLVVLAILALLMAILFPVFARVRAEARRTACISNLRQIGMALAMYREDYEELPQLLSSLTRGYVSAPALLVCPNDPRRGQFAGNVRLEGNTFLPSGVSYCYVPQWAIAQQLGWWQSSPSFGPGKWGDMTPIVECPWHWAKAFKPNQDKNDPGSKGWQLELMLSGSVRKIRVEDPLENFTPEKYR
jgi:type II secretory pathway pseudopilin PulG